jgi:type IV pilus assembly protein PilA
LEEKEMLKRMCLQMKKKNKGFTLIELIVVIAILGILAAVLIPTFSGFQSKAHSTQALVEAKQWATAADAYVVEKGLANAYVFTTVAGGDVAQVTATAGTTGSVTNATVSGTHVTFAYAIHGQTATRAADGTFTLTGTYTP